MIVVCFSANARPGDRVIQDFERLERRDLRTRVSVPGTERTDVRTAAQDVRPSSHCWIEQRVGRVWRTTGVGWEATRPCVRTFDIREKDERTQTIRRYRLTGLREGQEEAICALLDDVVGTAYNLLGDVLIGLCVLLRRAGVHLFYHLRTIRVFCSQLVARVLAACDLSVLDDLQMRDDQVTPWRLESWTRDLYPRPHVIPTPPRPRTRTRTRTRVSDAGTRPSRSQTAAA